MQGFSEHKRGVRRECVAGSASQYFFRILLNLRVLYNWAQYGDQDFFHYKKKIQEPLFWIPTINRTRACWCALKITVIILCYMYYHQSAAFSSNTHQVREHVKRNGKINCRRLCFEWFKSCSLGHTP